MKTSDKIKIMEDYLNGITIEFREIEIGGPYYTLVSSIDGGDPIWDWKDHEYREKAAIPTVILNITEDGYVKQYPSIAAAKQNKYGYCLIAQEYELKS